MKHTTRDLFVDRIMESIDHDFNRSEIRALEELVEREWQVCSEPAAPETGGPGAEK